MEYERYTDEKHPEGVYHVEVLEPVPSKPKRPLWRRLVRILLTVGAVFMVWSTLAPVFSYRCHRNKHDMHAHPQPEFSQPMDMDSSIGFVHEPDSDKPGAPVEHYTFAADIKSFWLKQENFPNPFPSRTHVIGKVIVHSCPKAENISTHVRFTLSDPSLRENIVVEPHNDGILFKLDPFSATPARINATIVVVVPKSDKYELERVSAKTIQLPVFLKDTFTTKINTTSIETVSGNVFSFGKSADKTALDINNLHIGTVSGGIHGEFPLNHALDLHSTSGLITASVVSSNLEEETGYIRTDSVSGNHDVTFLGKLHPRPLYSKHRSVSGDIAVHYPSDWQGGLELKTTSGHISVHGKGTKVVKKEKGIVGRFWEVIKGDGKSKGSLSTVSGRIKVVVGKNE
ncbi:hypothetical protein TWF696_005752 [Orbilia brochopaga]|uniref:Adhesin domain-containing protein n=1 Tax=Orbilia brochopaga TaxID=3140254 RepID=A0AAV9UVF9_9PEZI